MENYQIRLICFYYFTEIQETKILKHISNNPISHEYFCCICLLYVSIFIYIYLFIFYSKYHFNFLASFGLRKLSKKNAVKTALRLLCFY